MTKNRTSIPTVTHYKVEINIIFDNDHDVEGEEIYLKDLTILVERDKEGKLGLVTIHYGEGCIYGIKK